MEAEVPGAGKNGSTYGEDKAVHEAVVVRACQQCCEMQQLVRQEIHRKQGI